MALATLEQLKSHVRADEFEEDDGLLAIYLESAEETVLDEIGRSEAELVREYGKVPAPLRQATLLLAGFWYDHREAAGTGTVSELPFAVRSLTIRYKRLINDVTPAPDEPETAPEPEPDTDEPCEPEE